MNAETRPGSPAGLRAANRARVLQAVHRSGELTQAGLSAATGLAPATVSNIVRELAAAAAIEVADDVRGGRRVRVVRRPPGAGAVAGIDVGRRHVRVAVADLAHRVLAEDRAELPPDHDAAAGLSVARALLDDVLAAAGVDRAALLGAGLGIPAPVDGATGAVGAPGILPGWVGVDATAQARDRLGVPVWVDNDANLGTLAERRWGVLAGVDDAVYLKLSEGVGAGLVLGGALHRGPRGTAGEIGHVVVEPDGAVCRCGNRGCLETVASTSTVVGLLAPLLGDATEVADVVDAAAAGHAPSVRVLADTGARVGTALGAFCSVLTPDRVVIGGELAQAGGLLIDPLTAALHRSALPGSTTGTDVVVAALGDRAHVLGALALALDRATAAFPATA